MTWYLNIKGGVLNIIKKVKYEFDHHNSWATEPKDIKELIEGGEELVVVYINDINEKTIGLLTDLIDETILIGESPYKVTDYGLLKL